MDTKLKEKIAAALREHGCELARRTLTAPGGKLYAVTVIVPADRSGAFRPLRRRAPVKTA